MFNKILSSLRSPRVWVAILAGLAMLAGAVGLGLTVGSLSLMAVFASIAGLGIALAIGSIISYCRNYATSSSTTAASSTPPRPPVDSFPPLVGYAGLPGVVFPGVATARLITSSLDAAQGAYTATTGLPAPATGYLGSGLRAGSNTLTSSLCAQPELADWPGQRRP